MTAMALTAMASLVDGAEEALLFTDFAQAEHMSTLVLQGAGHPRAVKDRAAIVLLQALFETQRFDSARGFLCAAFGSLEGSPPNSLLLWISLALDTHLLGEAQAMILRLLQETVPAAAPGAAQPAAQAGTPQAAQEPGARACCCSGGGRSCNSSEGAAAASGGNACGGGDVSTAAWSRRQWLALLHLYVFEVLAVEMRELSEVQRWLRETQLPVSGEERTALMAEVDLLFPSTSSRPFLPGSCPGASASEAHREGRAMRMLPGGPAARSGAGSSGGEQWEAEERQGLLATTPTASGEGQLRRLRELRCGRGGGDGPGGSTPPRLAWLLKYQRQLRLAVQAFYAALLCSARSLLGVPATSTAATTSSGGRGGVPATAEGILSGQAVLGGVLGLVVAYSLWAERQALTRGLRRAKRGLLQSLADLCSMALSLSMSPMAPSHA